MFIDFFSASLAKVTKYIVINDFFVTFSGGTISQQSNLSSSTMSASLSIPGSSLTHQQSLQPTQSLQQSSNPNPATTKILYFTNRSATPFMSSLNKRIGEITLRDFKNLYDRPGFFRYHFKAVDQEFGMVKEEVRN